MVRSLRPASTSGAGQTSALRPVDGARAETVATCASADATAKASSSRPQNHADIPSPKARGSGSPSAARQGAPNLSVNKLAMLLFAGPAAATLTRPASEPSLTLAPPNEMHRALATYPRDQQKSGAEVLESILGRQGQLIPERMAEEIVKVPPASFFDALNLASVCGPDIKTAEDVFYKMANGWSLRKAGVVPVRGNAAQMNDLNIARLAFEQIFGAYVDRRETKVPVAHLARTGESSGLTFFTDSSGGPIPAAMAFVSIALGTGPKRAGNGVSNVMQTGFHETIHANTRPELKKMLMSLEGINSHAFVEGLTQFLTMKKWTHDPLSSGYDTAFITPGLTPLKQDGAVPPLIDRSMGTNELGMLVMHELTGEANAQQALTAGLDMLAKAFFSNDGAARDDLAAAVLKVRDHLHNEGFNIRLNNGNIGRLVAMVAMVLGGRTLLRQAMNSTPAQGEA